MSVAPCPSSQHGFIQLEAGQIPHLSQTHLNQSLYKSLNISYPVLAKPSSYFGCKWQDKIISSQFCLLPHHCGNVCVQKFPHKVSMLIQSTGMSSAMPHHGALSNRGHSRTGQNSLLASTEALLKAVSYQFPSDVLSAGNQSCFCGSTSTNKYLDEISLFGKQINTCSGNAASQVTSLWYHLVASKHSL